MAVTKLRIFISWAGDRAEILGNGFRDFLPDAINAVEPFISGRDIDKGTQWDTVLTGNLQESPCAIVCLTPESLSSIWVAFETGAISRAAGGPEGAKSRIWTYLFGLEKRELQLSPYAAYQATAATEQDTLKLLTSINQLSPDAVSPETLKRRFEKVFWPEYSKVIAAAQALQAQTAKEVPSETDINSEILLTVRSVQNELRNRRMVGYGGDVIDPILIRPLTREVVLNSILRELATRGVIEPLIITSPRGEITFRVKGRDDVTFTPGYLEQAIPGGKATAAQIAELIIGSSVTVPETFGGLRALDSVSHRA